MAQFRGILAEVDSNLTEEDLDGIIAEIDEDGSGTMDFDEFQEMMMGWYAFSSNTSIVYYDFTLHFP